MENREPTINISRNDKWLVGPSKSIAQSTLTCKFTGPKEIADALEKAFIQIASAKKPRGQQLELAGLVDSAGWHPASEEGNIVELPPASD